MTDLSTDDVGCDAPEHAAWCDRFGVPTNPAECRRCTDVRDPKRTGHSVEAAARYMAAKRDLGARFRQSRCPHHFSDGEKEDRVCCGGQVKKVDVPKCRKTGARAECETCTENVMPGVKALAASTAVPPADDNPLAVGVMRVLLRENAARVRMGMMRERFMQRSKTMSAEAVAERIKAMDWTPE